MTTITVFKNEAGELQGMTEKDRRSFARYKRMIDELEPGELFALEHWFPRNSKFHRMHFVIIHAIFEAQEKFDDVDAFRKWLYVGADHCDYYPTKNGMVAIAKSINFRTIDDADFAALHNRVIAFAKSDYATETLWPHLSAGDRSEMISAVLRGMSA